MFTAVLIRFPFNTVCSWIESHLSSAFILNPVAKPGPPFSSHTSSTELAFFLYHFSDVFFSVFSVREGAEMSKSKKSWKK